MDRLPFIGREKELKELNSLLHQKIATFVVIKGRRRIGKSRLVEEFAKDKKFLRFSGLPPTKRTTAKSQRNEFTKQLGEQIGIPGLMANDWSDIFSLLAKQVESGRVIILLDEISWMGSKDPDFLGKLKNAWDLYLKKNPRLILILCGSISSWIEKNIISSTGFFGRIDLIIDVPELSLSECNELLNVLGFRGSPMEKFMILAITGGIPRYLEFIKPKMTGIENIKNLCFRSNGLLVDEYKKIFHDLFGRRSLIYKKIVTALVNGPKTYTEVSEIIKYPKGGPLSEYFDDLVTSGFLSKDFDWDFKTGCEIDLTQYRLKDNYLRFYLKYIAPRLNKIKKGQYEHISLSSLPRWDSLISLQFENIVLNNRITLQKILGIWPEDIINDNPYVQQGTKKQEGCQIDYLIQTRQRCLYVCEIKFHQKELGSSVIKEVQKKINALIIPRGFICHPILIHVHGIKKEVEKADFFTKIIDFNQLL